MSGQEETVCIRDVDFGFASVRGWLQISRPEGAAQERFG